VLYTTPYIHDPIHTRPHTYTTPYIHDPICVLALKHTLLYVSTLQILEQCSTKRSILHTHTHTNTHKHAQAHTLSLSRALSTSHHEGNAQQNALFYVFFFPSISCFLVCIDIAIFYVCPPPYFFGIVGYCNM